ncbi:hypothetical protein ACJD0Z_17620 [Flavobacteriaceae bacterium M23B6Z8]
MNKFYIISLILGFLAFLSCSDDDPKIPPITTENTFSCKIDGELFVPKDHGGFPIQQSGILVSIEDNNSWYFTFGDGSKDLFLYITNVTSKGDFSLELSDGDKDFFQENKNLMELDFETVSNFATHISTTESGKIQVLELEINKHIIIQFDELILRDTNNPQNVVMLTEGKININLETFSESN